MSNSNLAPELGGKSLHNLVSICPDPIIGVDCTGMINVFNLAAANLLGYSPEDVIAQLHITELYGSREVGRAIKRMIYSDQCGAHGQIEGYEASVLTSNGLLISIRLSATILLEQGKEIGSVGFFHDQSGAKAMEARLRQLSITDDLSGLYNRRYFNTILADEMARSSRYNRPLSLIYIDMDHFKEVNDLMGHQEGDRAIKTLAAALHSTLRGTDLAFRYGGDEFVALLPEAQLEEASVLAERIRSSAAVRITSQEDSSMTVYVTLSIGVAEYDMKEETLEFLKRADKAMYEAKHAGGNRIGIR